jgi:hypothetical protein
MSRLLAVSHSGIRADHIRARDLGRSGFVPGNTSPSTIASARCSAATGVMLLVVLATSPVSADAQQARRAVVAVLPLAVHPATAHADSMSLAAGIAALLESALVADPRIRIARAPERRPTGASHAVSGEILRVGDSIRVTARVLRLRDTVSVALDPLTAASDEIPQLVDDLADAVFETLDLAPPAGGLRRGGGPVFRPPRPPVPLVAMSLYSRAVAARE